MTSVHVFQVHPPLFSLSISIPHSCHASDLHTETASGSTLRQRRRRRLPLRGPQPRPQSVPRITAAVRVHITAHSLPLSAPQYRQSNQQESRSDGEHACLPSIFAVRLDDDVERCSSSRSGGGGGGGCEMDFHPSLSLALSLTLTLLFTAAAWLWSTADKKPARLCLAVAKDGIGCLSCLHFLALLCHRKEVAGRLQGKGKGRRDERREREIGGEFMRQWLLKNSGTGKRSRLSNPCFDDEHPSVVVKE